MCVSWLCFHFVHLCYYGGFFCCCIFIHRTQISYLRQQKFKISAHSKHALKCHYSPDYKHFATTGADGYVHLWDITNVAKPVKSLFVASDLTTVNYLEKFFIVLCF